MLLLLCAPVTAHAATLGEVVAQSAIGEPLRVELRLAAGSLAQAGECLRVSPGAASDGPWVVRGRISTTPQDGGRIVISDRTPVSEPVLRLGIENLCGTRFRREYTLLLPFPDTPAPPVSARRSDPVATPARSAAPPPRPAAPPPRDERLQTWTTAPGESLEALAAALYPREADARRAFIAATVRANPELFGDAASRSRALPAGTELRVPDPSRVLAAPPPAARPPDTARRSETAPAPAPAPAPSATPRVESDRLVVEGDTDTSASARPVPADGPGAAMMARERELVAALDRSIQAQLDLLERIRELERLQASLIERASQLGTDLPARPAGAAPTAPPDADGVPTARVPDTQRARSTPGWLTYLLLFAAVVAALLGLQTLQRRRAQRLQAEQAARENATPLATGAWPAEAMATAGLEPARGEQTLTPETSAPQTETATPDYDWAAPSLPQAAATPITVHEETIEEHESAVELAEIMMSFGRVQGAAETLAEFIRSNPRQAIKPWLKLLDVYRAAGMRAEFDGLSRQLNKTFNVTTVTWDSYDEARAARHHVEDMPHVVDQLCRSWGTVACQAYLEKLIRDNRDGTRQGFPLTVIDELLTLAAVLEIELGRYRPTDDRPPA